MTRMILTALVALFLAGCSTMAGLGQDIEKLGSKLRESASK